MAAPELELAHLSAAGLAEAIRRAEKRRCVLDAK
jgi:hypothetical protein